jgi:hypothetical protein
MVISNKVSWFSIVIAFLVSRLLLYCVKFYRIYVGASCSVVIFLLVSGLMVIVKATTILVFSFYI